MPGRDREPATGGIAGRRPRADVLEISEPIEELAAEQVEIPVAIEVREVRGRPAEDLEILAGHLHARGGLILRRLVRTFIAEPIDEAAQRALGPDTLGIIAIIPAVIGPIADAHDHIGPPVAVVVDDLPHVRPHLARVDVRGQRQFLADLEPGAREVRVLDPGRKHARFAICAHAELDVLQAFADPDAGRENRQRLFGGVDTGLEHIHPVRGLVGAVHDQVEFAVAVEIHRERPSPEADAQIHDQARMVVFQALENALCGQVGRRIRPSRTFHRPSDELGRVDDHMLGEFALPGIGHVHEAVGRLDDGRITELGLGLVLQDQRGFPDYPVPAHGEVERAATLGGMVIDQEMTSVLERHGVGT